MGFLQYWALLRHRIQHIFLYEVVGSGSLTEQLLESLLMSLHLSFIVSGMNSWKMMIGINDKIRDPVKLHSSRVKIQIKR